MIRWLALLLVLACPATAQRPACGFGLGLNAMAAAEHRLAAASAAPSLESGRDAAGAATRGLEEAWARFEGCGCTDLAEYVRDAAAAAQMAALAPDFPLLSARLDATRSRLVAVREGLGRRGCR